MKAIIMASMLISSVSFANRESGGRLGASAVYVDFRSYGTGIDPVTNANYEKLVLEAKNQGLVIDETKEMRGREGETLSCVQLSSAFDRYNFIRRLAPSILFDTQTHGLQRTSVYVGVDCNSFDQATEQDLSQY